jgi:deazaflavin-dependent oxidoreductase (nitroreductase family)
MMEADLTAWGKAITLETIGRHSGLPRRVTIGFIEDGDGSLLVAGASDATHWTRNLKAEPRCAVELADHQGAYRAELLDDVGRQHAVSGLILKYGTPAERLGAGPAFRLVPLLEAA